MATERWIVDTDLGLGGPSGDVDDGFALVALSQGAFPIEAVTTVFGNTTESWAHRNGTLLAERLKMEFPLVRGAAKPGPGETAASQFLKARPHCPVLALGPLTNVANALAHGGTPPPQVVAVGGNASSRGRWPPFWPFEFNLTHDPWATTQVLERGTPLTLVPLDVCGRFRFEWGRVACLPGELGRWMGEHSVRWWRRAMRKGQRQVPIWDLVAALYVMHPEEFEVRNTTVGVTRRGGLRWGTGPYPARWVSDFDPDSLWSRFETLLSRDPG